MVLRMKREREGGEATKDFEDGVCGRVLFGHHLRSNERHHEAQHDHWARERASEHTGYRHLHNLSRAHEHACFWYVAERKHALT